MDRKKQIELLSPAGTMESVHAAVNNGCNAIYLGGKQFSARQYAGNFTLEELEEVCDYCHLRDVKVYVTVNTVYKDSEMKELLSFVEKLYAMGVDALIVQDMGAAALIHKNFPDFRLHASTQLTTNSVEDVKFLAAHGFCKVVLSRELSLEEIKKIVNEGGLAVETFIHGALCVSYSGQCIMSSMLGGRSGNRGRCAQTCRLPYTLYHGYQKVEEGHLLSPKDIQTVTILPQLIEAGISSFKIEGRMKSPEYVAGVTGIYRKYMDLYFQDPKQYHVEEKDLNILLQLFNRGGFSEGYYHTHAGKSMMCIERPKSWGLKAGFIDSYDKRRGCAFIRTREPLVPGDGIEVWTNTQPHVGTNISKQSRAGEVIRVMLKGDIDKNNVVYKTHDKALSDFLKKTYQKETRTQKIFAEAYFKIGQAASLKLFDSAGNSVFVTGETVEEAQNQPMSKEKIAAQLKKTGGTAFDIEELSLHMDEGIYLGISSLNELRRRALEALAEKIIQNSKRNVPAQKVPPVFHKEPFVFRKKLTVLVNNFLQFLAAVENEAVSVLYFELGKDLEENFEQCIDLCHKKQISFFVALPRIYRSYVEKIYSPFFQKLKESQIDGVLVRSPGEFLLAQKLGKKIHVDYSFNPFNSECVSFWQQTGAEMVCLSPELNLSEINTIGNAQCEMLGYGYLPLMTTHQCPIGNFDGEKEAGIYCKRRDCKEEYTLKDRKGERFFLFPDCTLCVCSILNGKPLFTLKFFDEILASPTGYLRLAFTKEAPKEVDEIICAYAQMLTYQRPNALVNRLLHQMEEKGSTKGHYFRGAE